MVNIAATAHINRLLEELGGLEDQLMPNELEMMHSLKQKYAEPITADPFDVTALEVILRNIEVRKGFRIDPKKDGGRVIDLPRSSDLENDEPQSGN